MATAGRGEPDLTYFDAAGFSVNPVRRDAWTRTGGQTAVFPQRHSLLFNVPGRLLHGEWVWQDIGARVDAAAAIGFMNERAKRLRRRTILVLDKASVHNCKILRAWQVK